MWFLTSLNPILCMSTAENNICYQNISNHELLLVIGCICKIRPFINSRNSLLTSSCFQLRVVGCSLAELSTGLHSIYTSLVRQV